MNGVGKVGCLPGAVWGGKVMEDDLSKALSHQWWGSSKQEARAAHINVALAPPGSWRGEDPNGIYFCLQSSNEMDR